jgi:hypothetical protein
MGATSEAEGGHFDALDDAEINKFRLKIMFVSGVGFFTDAHDLFVIGIVVALLKTQWSLSTGQVSWINSATLLASAVGAIAFGRVADILGPQPHLRLRGADPRLRRDSVGVRAQLHVPADRPGHPGHRDRWRLPGVGHSDAAPKSAEESKAKQPQTALEGFMVLASSRASRPWPSSSSCSTASATSSPSSAPI